MMHIYMCHEVDLENIPPIVWPLISTQCQFFRLALPDQLLINEWIWL